mmetsp:Transcript_18641/g.35879  ORF Transcript_18641/g.35879 Transcript_18641/m.35879 type:complete len:142 (+) Transcript_18641:42-467(+)
MVQTTVDDAEPLSLLSSSIHDPEEELEIIRGPCKQRFTLKWPHILAGILVSAVVVVVGCAAVGYGGYGAVGHGSSFSSTKLPLDPVGLEAVGAKEIKYKFMDSKMAQDVKKLAKTPPEMNAGQLVHDALKKQDGGEEQRKL